MGGYKTPNFLHRTLLAAFFKKMDIYCPKEEEKATIKKYEKEGWELVKSSKNHGNLCLHFKKKVL